MKKILVIVVIVLLFFVMSDKGSLPWKSFFNNPDEVEIVKNDVSEKVLAVKKMPEASIETKRENHPVSNLEPEIQKALEVMVNTSSEGLVEEKTDNGVRVDLQGRFQTVPVATINEAGELEIQDYNSVPKKAN